jgi:hypothetical protein
MFGREGGCGTMLVTQHGATVSGSLLYVCFRFPHLCTVACRHVSTHLVRGMQDCSAAWDSAFVEAKGARQQQAAELFKAMRSSQIVSGCSIVELSKD